MNTGHRKLLSRFQYLWERDPRWLAYLPNIPDPRRQPDRARLAARAMLQVETVPQGVGAIERIAA